MNMTRALAFTLTDYSASSPVGETVVSHAMTGWIMNLSARETS